MGRRPAVSIAHGLGRASRIRRIPQFTEIARQFTAIDRRFDAMNDQFTELRREMLGHFDELYLRFERLEQEYHAIPSEKA